MATKQDLINLIDSNLKKDGNATGPAINALLKSMLDFTENKEVGFFSFQSEKPENDLKGKASLNYSLRGIANRWVNFTFKLLIEKSEDVDREKLILKFTIKDEIFYTLRTLYKMEEPIYFTVPMQVNNELFSATVIGLNLIVEEGKKLLSIEIHNANKIKSSVSIFTSVQFHSPDFKKK